MLVLAGGLLPGSLRAQESPPLRLSVSEPGATLSFHLGDVLEEGAIRDALEAGLPLRVVVAVELWKDELFDDHEGRTEWRATVLHDPLSGRYRLSTSGPRGVDETLESVEEARAALQRTVRPALRPREEGSYYYTAAMEVQTFSASDLEELQRWLRGEVAPAMAGERDAESVLKEGVRRLFVRLLGLPARRYRTRTPTFDYTPPLIPRPPDEA